MTSKLRNWIVANISSRWLILLVVVIVASCVSARFGVLIEDIQHLIFPLLLLIVWRLPRNPQFRMPFPLVAAVFVLWIVFNRNAVFGSRSIAAPVVISRLEGDSNGLTARSLCQRYNEIAVTYRLPSATTVQRYFTQDSQALGWRNDTPGDTMIVRGKRTWLRVILSSAGRSLINGFSTIVPENRIPQATRSAVEQIGLSLSRDIAFVQPPTLGFPVAVVYEPEAFNLPADVPELSLHFLAWLAAGLESLPSLENTQALYRTRALRYAALREALLLDGSWTTGGPLGLALHLVTTLDLLEALSDSAWGNGPLEGAVAKFERVTAFARRNVDPETFAAALNNAAVAMAAKSVSPQDLRQAKRWLSKAMGTVNADHLPVRGAKAAFLNLYLLDSSGL